MTPISRPGSMQPHQLTEIRERLGLSRGEFAQRLGISRSQLFNFELGRDRRTGRPAPIPRAIELAALALQAGLGTSAPAQKPTPKEPKA